MATATVQMEIDGVPVRTAELGDGPVDATLKAIKKLTKTKAKLQQYNVGSITGGTDAQGEVTVRLAEGERTVVGRGSSTDIIEASAKAYIHALNRLHLKERRWRACSRRWHLWRLNGRGGTGEGGRETVSPLFLTAAIHVGRCVLHWAP